MSMAKRWGRAAEPAGWQIGPANLPGDCGSHRDAFSRAQRHAWKVAQPEPPMNALARCPAAGSLDGTQATPRKISPTGMKINAEGADRTTA